MRRNMPASYMPERDIVDPGNRGKSKAHENTDHKDLKLQDKPSNMTNACSCIESHSYSRQQCLRANLYAAPVKPDAVTTGIYRVALLCCLSPAISSLELLFHQQAIPANNRPYRSCYEHFRVYLIVALTLLEQRMR